MGMETGMKLSQLPQYVGVRYAVAGETKGKLVASGPNFRVVVEKNWDDTWYVLIHSDLDGDKHAGEYGIDLKWSRNNMLCVMDSVIRYYLGKGQFPSQLKGFVV